MKKDFPRWHCRAMSAVQSDFDSLAPLLKFEFSCCNCNASRQHTNDVPNTITQPAAAITYNCENFYGHYDNRKNINVLEPEKSQRNKEAEYPLTGNRLLIGRNNSQKMLFLIVLGINIESVQEGLGTNIDRPGTWNSANQFKNLCTDKMNFTNVGFRRNAKEMEVRKDFARLRSLVDDTIGSGLSNLVRSLSVPA